MGCSFHWQIRYFRDNKNIALILGWDQISNVVVPEREKHRLVLVLGLYRTQPKRMEYQFKKRNKKTTVTSSDNRIMFLIKVKEVFHFPYKRLIKLRALRTEMFT